MIGGNSDKALSRVAAYGDGWYGFNLSAADTPGRLTALARECHHHGRALADPGAAAAWVAAQAADWLTPDHRDECSTPP